MSWFNFNDDMKKPNGMNGDENAAPVANGVKSNAPSSLANHNYDEGNQNRLRGQTSSIMFGGDENDTPKPRNGKVTPAEPLPEPVQAVNTNKRMPPGGHSTGFW